MKKIQRIVSVLCVFLMAVGPVLQPVDVYAFSGVGNGTAGNPYKISTCAELQEISNALSAHYALLGNVDCTGTTAWNSGAGFAPIGTSTFNSFSGVLDGRNHAIDGLFINRSASNVGLFGFLSGTVKNLSLTNINISATSGNYHGGLVGEAIGATIADVSVQGSMTGNSVMGGFAGYIHDGSTIDRSSFVGTSTDTSSYGSGFAGWVRSSTISDSYAQANYVGTNAGGGFVDRLFTSDAIAATINRSYFVGDVDNHNYGATFLSSGEEFSSGQVTVNDSFSVGTGYNGVLYVMRPFSSLTTGTPTASNFYYDQTAAGVASCGGSYTCTAVNTDGLDGDHFKSNSTVPPLDTWDFVNVWQANSFDYPTLRTPQLSVMGYGLSGSGTEGDPYLVTDCDELQTMNDYDVTIGLYFKLGGDIDCSATTGWNGGAGFVPIGTSHGAFAGYFDGDSHTISGLFMDNPSHYAGLFDRTAVGSVIHDVTLDGFDITNGSRTGALVGYARGDITNVTVTNLTLVGSSYYVGGIAGYAYTSDMTNVHVSGSISSDGDETGGIIGQYDGGTLSNCSYSGDMLTYYESGGIIGENEGVVTIHRCFSEGSITATDTDTGGIVGEAEADITITESYSTMTVVGDGSTGGLIGAAYGDVTLSDSFYNGNGVTGGCDTGSVIGYVSSSYTLSATNVYGTGPVAGGCDEAGFIGDSNTNNVFSGSYWNKNTTGFSVGCSVSGECDGVTGLTTAQMQNSNVFINGGWDFDSTWAQKAGYNSNYPCLQWVGSACTGTIIPSVPNTSSGNTSTNDVEAESDTTQFSTAQYDKTSNDNKADSEKTNIATVSNPLTSNDATLEVDEQCSVEHMYMLSESETGGADDVDFNYPAGLMDFRIDCGEAGYTTTVKQYYYDVSGDFVVRKFNPATGYSTIDDAVITDDVIDGRAVKVVTYKVTDGGVLDIDGQANGVIVDPAGLGQAKESVKVVADSSNSTVENNYFYWMWLLLIPGIIFIIAKKRKKKQEDEHRV